jgi:hypothetical protein
MSQGRRERKQEFWARVEQEGRREQAQAAWKALLASGLDSRQAQEELVVRFQPLDGSRTRAWPTPNSWQKGRQQWRKAPATGNEERDRAVIWAYQNRKTPLSQAPTKLKKRWLTIVQKNPQAFYEDRFLQAWAREKQRRDKRQRRRQQPNWETEDARRKGYDDDYSDGEWGNEHRYHADAADENNEDESDEMPGVQLPPAPTAVIAPPVRVDIRDAKPAGAQPTGASPEPTSLRGEASAPEPPQAMINGPPPELCPLCGWPPPGSAYCSRCKFVHNAGPNNLPSGLKMEPDGMIYQVGSPAVPVVQGWHRCEVCNAPYQGIRPPFGTPKLCPRCLPGPDGRRREPKGR